MYNEKKSLSTCCCFTDHDELTATTAAAKQDEANVIHFNRPVSNSETNPEKYDHDTCVNFYFAKPTVFDQEGTLPFTDPPRRSAQRVRYVCTPKWIYGGCAVDVNMSASQHEVFTINTLKRS